MPSRMRSRRRTSSSNPRRPGVLRWLWYALTGRLPIGYRGWVLYDLTCGTWPLRHLARLLVPLVPVAAVLTILLPGAWSIRITAALMGSAIGLLFTFAFLDEATDRRAVRFGYPSGTAARVRKQRRTREQHHRPG
jgi:hypothetical protein